MYLGNQPALAYTSFAKQDFTTSATTSYVLDQPVANANEIALFINFVRQEPTTAYSASGTALTLTAATSASDDMYCVFLGKALQTVNPPAGSVGASQITDGTIGLSKLSATGTKDATTFLRGDNTFASAGGANTPMFYGRLASTLALSRNVNTKVTGMTTNEIDTDSAFDGTTFTVPSGKGGRYFFTAYGYFDFNTEGNDGESVELRFKKNNTTSYAVAQYQMSVQGQIARFPLFISSIIDLSAGDYVEIFAQSYDQTGSGTGGSLFTHTFFSGYKIIE